MGNNGLLEPAQGEQTKENNTMNLNKLNNSELVQIEQAIEDKIRDHEALHSGLYTDNDLLTLRPIWRNQIVKDLMNDAVISDSRALKALLDSIKECCKA